MNDSLDCGKRVLFNPSGYSGCISAIASLNEDWYVPYNVESVAHASAFYIKTIRTRHGSLFAQNWIWILADIRRRNARSRD